jgi:glycosyltransferase involved in cell wall biosynthesis
VDDHSPDRTVERAAQIGDPRLQIQVNDTNLGLGDSVLRALNTIDTPFVALLNSDDLFHPERLERCRDVLKGSAQAQVVATSLVPIDGDGRRLTTDNVSRLFDGRQIADWIQWFSAAGAVRNDADLVAELLERNFLITSSNIVCRTEFLRSRAESIHGLKYCLDWQVFLDAAVDGVLVHLTEELLGYRLHRSNTVWFDDERRRSYVTEVNRVLARVFGHLRQQSSRPGRRDRAGVLDLLVSHAAKHSEADGFALYAADLLEGRGLKEAREPKGSSSSSRRDAITMAAQALADVAQEEAAIARAAERCLTEDRHRSEAERQRSAEELHRYEAETRRLEAQREQELHRAAEELRRHTAEREQSEEERRRHEAEREQVEADLRRQMAAQVEDIARLRSSPEWLVGDAVCNRTGLSRVFPVVRRASRAVRDRRNRWTLALGAFTHRIGLTRPRAIVASCWNFPTHSHTFVYEEMQALEWAGFDSRVFCCGTNARSELHPAFESLWRRRVVLESDWSFNRRDYEHFRQTRPERLEALLARLGAATGLAREELLQQSIVMMGFTFARHVELSGAEYLHTYFFYDQSFLALMAGYLLEIPRGVTAYADHMLGDYAFKCVPLHLELADIVVATSRRIGSELSAIGGGRFDAKIVVKPNGIDTARFPYVDAGARLKAAGDPELISVSRIEPKKGLVHLVEAVGILEARGVTVRLHLVGGPDTNSPAGAECLQQLTATIDRLELADRVVMHGVLKQPDFLPLMMKSRMFVAPYVEVASGDKDGIPTAVLEAMSTGLPVISTDAGSIVEAVTDGSEGVIVPQRDAVGLADAIERLLTNPAMYRRMGAAARHRAVSEFDVHVTEKRLHERIKGCLQPHAAIMMSATEQSEGRTW